MKFRRVIPYLAKFGVVGFTGVFIDYSLTYFAKEKLLLNGYFSNIIGFTFAATSNFYFNRVWTFDTGSENVLKQFFSFAGISLIGLLLNSVILFGFHELLRIPFYYSKSLAIFLVFIWNFTLNYLFTYKKSVKFN